MSRFSDLNAETMETLTVSLQDTAVVPTDDGSLYKPTGGVLECGRTGVDETLDTGEVTHGVMITLDPQGVRTGGVNNWRTIATISMDALQPFRTRPPRSITVRLDRPRVPQLDATEVRLLYTGGTATANPLAEGVATGGVPTGGTSLVLTVNIENWANVTDLIRVQARQANALRHVFFEY